MVGSHQLGSGVVGHEDIVSVSEDKYKYNKYNKYNLRR
jgi:hypothetical protein